MAIEAITVDNEGESFTYLPDVADNEDQGQVDFLTYLLEC